MSKLSDRLKQLRLEKQMTQQALSDLTGISKSSVNMYERGEREPGIDTLEALADTFNVDMDYLVGKSDFRSKSAWLREMGDAFASGSVDADGHPYLEVPDSLILLPRTYTVPLLGAIVCDEPILTAENYDGEVAVPNEIKADLALRFKGDSMINAHIRDGDIVYVRQQDTVENGEIAAVLIDGEATLKRFAQYDDRIVLTPANAAYSTMDFIGEQLSKIRVIGKAVAFLSRIR